MTARHIKYPDQDHQIADGPSEFPLIGGFLPATLQDFPGRVAAAIFLGGCNFRCPYCHNPGLVNCRDCHPAITPDYLLHFLEKRKGLLDGIVISGGEPTIHPELPSLVRYIKSSGYQVKLDTNGSNPDLLVEIISSLDYIAMDMKNCREKYSLTAGHSVDYSRIKESINIVLNSGLEYEFRTTVHSSFHDLADILKIADQIKGARQYSLQLARNKITLETLPENKYTPSILKSWKKQLESKAVIDRIVIRA